MKNQKKQIHLICNAHLDPVWLWEWQEGAAEVLATFRTAAQLCEKNKTFIFNHNEAILYKWVQEYDPPLFKQIQKLVRAGKWHIMGGWYLQPDCNMPSGESLVRQILSGKDYFRKYFGVEPSTAINFDPFGHSRGLVQILAKSGYDSYLFGRPEPKWLDLPAEDFIWVGYDGSRILSSRLSGWYNTPLGEARNTIEHRIRQYPGKQTLAMLWGVGNHGGGPSRKDLADVNDLIKTNTKDDVFHSTPESYFRDLRKNVNELPRFDKDFNPFAVGCYTSQVRIKQKHRLLENEIFSLEKMASTAASQELIKYPDVQIHEALEDLMLSQFHDILPGSSIESAEQASLRLLEHGLEITSRLKMQTFTALCSGQAAAQPGRIPVMVYNHHPFKINGLVECEIVLPDVNISNTLHEVFVYHNGKKIPAQVEKEQSNLLVEFRKKVVFEAQLAPGQMNRFDCELKPRPKKPILSIVPGKEKFVFKNPHIEVVINTKTGLIDKFRVKGVDYLGRNAFEPLIIADNEDPWGMTTKSFQKTAGRFKLMGKKEATQFCGVKLSSLDPVHIIEDGPVRTVIESVFTYNKSQVCQRYSLPKTGTEIGVETRVHWNEKNKMLKLSIPLTGQNFKYVGQSAYGVSELPFNGNEAVSQKWAAVICSKTNRALTCINDGTYGSDCSEQGLRLSLLRSPVHACLPYQDRVSAPQDRYTPRVDQGVHVFRFWLNAGQIVERLACVDREALVKNEKPYVLFFFPSGQGKKVKPLAVLSDDVVQITALKKSQDGKHLIVRLFEPTGQKRTTVLSMPAIKQKIKVKLNGFEIKTLKINVRQQTVSEVNLLEQI